MVQAMALDEDEVPEIADETVPDAEGMARYLLNNVPSLCIC